MLNLTDIAYGVKGHNNYYQIQILKKQGSYVFFTKWGRVGAPNPQSKYEDFDSKIDAIRAFKRNSGIKHRMIGMIKIVFRLKLGNIR